MDNKVALFNVPPSLLLSFHHPSIPPFPSFLLLSASEMSSGHSQRKEKKNRGGEGEMRPLLIRLGLVGKCVSYMAMPRAISAPGGRGTDLAEEAS